MADAKRGVISFVWIGLIFFFALCLFCFGVHGFYLMFIKYHQFNFHYLCRLIVSFLLSGVLVYIGCLKLANR